MDKYNIYTKIYLDLHKQTLARFGSIINLLTRSQMFSETCSRVKCKCVDIWPHLDQQTNEWLGSWGGWMTGGIFHIPIKQTCLLRILPHAIK